MEQITYDGTVSTLPAPMIKDFNVDINGDPFKYRENKKLKSRGTVLPYTRQHIDELIKCSNDIFYFANNYFQLVHPDDGLIQVKLRDYQEECISNFMDYRFNICLWPRQSGKSSSFAIFVCHFILFNAHKNVVILANKEKQSKEMLSRIKKAYECLPFWMQQGIESWAKLSIELENGSKISAEATSSDAARGESVSLLIIDETANIPTTIWDEFYESVYPTIAAAKTSRVILTSTMKGMNHFYKLWRDAISMKNDFHPYEVKWYDVPGYDEEFKRVTIANTSKRKWSQEFENKALASADSLIDVEVVEKIDFIDPIDLETIPELYGPVMEVNQHFEEMFAVYRLPVAEHRYGIGVDPAKITEDSAGDSVALQVFDLTTIPYEQVCSINIPSEIHYLELPEMIDVLGRYYNEAWMFVENNDSVGQQVADTLLLDYEYENIYTEKPGISGFRTTKANKKIGCLNLKMLVEREQLVLHDFDTISQLSTFVKHKLTYAAEVGYKDDSVMAMIHGLVFMQDRIFFEEKMELVHAMLGKAPPKELKREYEFPEEDEPMPMASSLEEDLENINIFN